MAAGVFETLYTAYSTTLSTVANTYAGQWTPIAVEAFAASGAIYFTILGFLVIRGAVARPLAELGVSAMKFALVIAALGSLGFVNLAISGINQLGPALLGTGNSNIGQSMDTYYAGVEKLKVAMDKREADSATAANNNAGADQSIIGSMVSSLTGFDLQHAIEQIEDYLAYLVALICAAVSSAVGFCVLFFAQIALDIVLAFTPIAIACCFWPQTRWFFQGWLSQAINYVVLYIVVIIISKMVIAASVTTISTFVGPSADIVAVAGATADPALEAAVFLEEAAEVALIYLVGTFLFFQAPSIASGLAGGAASGGHTFLAIAANQIASRVGGGGRTPPMINPARGGSISRG